MVDIGRLRSISGITHKIQKNELPPKLSRPILPAIETIQPSCKAYKTALEEQSAKPLKNRAKKLKKAPFGEEIPGPARNIPPKGV